MRLELVDPFSPTVERTWRGLEEAAPHSYFLSWGWIESWLACLPKEHLPRLGVIHDQGRPVAACFLSRRLVRRHHVLPSNAMFLNTTGVQRFDALWIEYNGLVGHDLPVSTLIGLLPEGLDELFLPGMHGGALGGLYEAVIRGYRVRIDRKVPSFLVDLDRVRTSGYLELLGSQTRAQVRRARREAGELTVEVATDDHSAREIYDELVRLHTAVWRARGQPGAFADPWFERFHRRLIATRLRHGEIELLRVRSATQTIGVLYNFVHAGRVLQYQSGFAQFDNKHLKPGYLCHAAAIERAATAVDRSVYDFLAGDVRYKQSLSTHQTMLYWARIQRQAIRFMLEDRLRRWAAMRRAASGSAQSS